MNKDTCQAQRVVARCGKLPGAYPSLDQAPYHPGELYPEFPGGSVSVKPNLVFGQVRDVLADLGLDQEHFGTSAWNPLGALVAPGAKIVVKPNWVLHRNEGPGGTDCLITHAAVLRAVLDYVLLAKPREVVVGDAPIQDCDFEALLALGSRAVVDYFAGHGFPVRLVDFRRTVLSVSGGKWEVRENMKPLDQYVTVDLGSESLLEPISADADHFRVTKYDPRLMRPHHQPGRHRYLIARDVLEADLVVNLPKLKTHKKAGLTAALKNLVGINGNKEYLPHHRKGSAGQGGDNYDRFSLLKWLAEQVEDLANRHRDKSAFYGFCQKLNYGLLVMNMKMGGDGEVEGSWWGNDTVWRMCLDLNRVLLYADQQGVLQNGPMRRILSIADAVVAGEGEGPLKSTPYAMNVILGSLNPAAADWLAALLMGLDPEKLPIINHAFHLSGRPLASYPPSDLDCRMNGQSVSLSSLRPVGPGARPARGWLGHCERAITSENVTPLC